MGRKYIFKWNCYKTVLKKLSRSGKGALTMDPKDIRQISSPGVEVGEVKNHDSKQLGLAAGRLKNSYFLVSYKSRLHNLGIDLAFCTYAVRRNWLLPRLITNQETVVESYHGYYLLFFFFHFTTSYILLLQQSLLKLTLKYYNQDTNVNAICKLGIVRLFILSVIEMIH